MGIIFHVQLEKLASKLLLMGKLPVLGRKSSFSPKTGLLGYF
jgi:hypothetical protein